MHTSCVPNVTIHRHTRRQTISASEEQFCRPCVLASEESHAWVRAHPRIIRNQCRACARAFFPRIYRVITYACNTGTVLPYLGIILCVRAYSRIIQASAVRAEPASAVRACVQMDSNCNSQNISRVILLIIFNSQNISNSQSQCCASVPESCELACMSPDYNNKIIIFIFPERLPRQKNSSGRTSAGRAFLPRKNNIYYASSSSFSSSWSKSKPLPNPTALVIHHFIFRDGKFFRFRHLNPWN